MIAKYWNIDWEKDKWKILSAIIALVIIVGLIIYYRKRNSTTRKGKGAMSKRPYIFESLVKDNKEQFIGSVEDTSRYLGLDSPNDMMAVMKSESGLRADIVNPNGNATGLIQFMPSTAKRLGTTPEALRAMSNVEQMKYVRAYFEPYRGKIKNFTDLYTVTFFPIALGKPDNWVIESKNLTAEAIAASNRGFDLDKDGKIKYGEFKQAIMNRLPAAERAYVS